MDKKKLVTSVVAVATAAALVLGGTFAWQSINQTALNEASDVVNPGGRLHDDFDGTNKNVYVENFAEDEIFARVRFDEYMEIIMNYGGGDAQKTEVVTAGATKEDTSTYVTHKFGEANATDDFWNWTMGGQDPDAETPYYMPTFNLNKDSLAADVNGVFNGANFTITDKDDGDQYVDTYVEWTDGDTKEGYEIYDSDTNSVDELSQQYGQLKELTEAVNDIIDNGTGSQYYNADNLVLTEEKVAHTAAQVNAETGFISMADWDGTPGAFWVYDTDGWCYWAQPIDAGETTGLLMDGIALDGVMDDTWYYAINVVAQFITANDIGDGTAENPGFMQDGMTPEAEALLEAIGVDVDGTGGGSGGEDEYEYTQETMDELNVRTASMDVYRGTQYTITYAYDGDVDSAWLYSVEMSSADSNHLSEVHCDGDEVVIAVHPDEPNDTLTLTYTFDYDDSYELTMTLNVLDGEGEGYLEPTDTLPVITITWSEETGNTASATVNRGEIYEFAGFQYAGMDVGNVKGETFMLSGAVEPESYVGYDDGNNPLLVIEANEPNDTLTLTGTVHMDNDIPFTMTLTVLDGETGGGDEWMPEFTTDEDATVSFTKYAELMPDTTEYANCLYFHANAPAKEGLDSESIEVQIFDKNGVCLTNEHTTCDVASNQVRVMAITPVPEGTAEGDKFTGVATWTVDGVTYGISGAYNWDDGVSGGEVEPKGAMYSGGEVCGETLALCKTANYFGSDGYGIDFSVADLTTGWTVKEDVTYSLSGEGVSGTYEDGFYYVKSTTPTADLTGTDSFTFTVTMTWGEETYSCDVTVYIVEQNLSMIFAYDQSTFASGSGITATISGDHVDSTGEPMYFNLVGSKIKVNGIEYEPSSRVYAVSNYTDVEYSYANGVYRMSQSGVTVMELNETTGYLCVNPCYNSYSVDLAVRSNIDLDGDGTEETVESIITLKVNL